MKRNPVLPGRAKRLTRIAAAAAAGISLALLSASVASAKQGVDVPCGQAALVAAINNANSSGGGTISLAKDCHYELTSADNGENGLPLVTSPITVNGNGATIDGTDSVRVFEVDGPGGALSLDDVTITGGSADAGGGIANIGGSVSLDHSQVSGNAAGFGGGGIVSVTFDPSSVATLTLDHSVVNDNQQTAGLEDNPIGGGGILNLEGTATIEHSQVNGNTAQGFVGGGIANGDYLNFTNSDSVLTLDHSQVNGNTAPNAGGGGIQNLLGSVTANHSQVNGNTSLNGGGIASGNANGGSVGPAVLKLSHSEVNGNTATAPVPPPPPNGGPPIAAGGIANGSQAVLDHTQVDNNTASFTSGAGIVNHGAMALEHSEVNGNTAAGSGPAASGGGILNAASPDAPGTGVLALDYTRVNDNSAGGNGGGISNGLQGTGLVGGAVTLTNSQVTRNSATHGGGIFNKGGTVTLSNSAVTGNNPDNCYPPNSVLGCTG